MACLASLQHFLPTQAGCTDMNAIVTQENRDHFSALRLLLQALQADVRATLDAARAASKAPTAGDLSATRLESYADSTRRESVYTAVITQVVQDLQNVEDALVRLRDGTYGIRGRCAGKIPGSQLADLPTVLFCNSCQEP